MKNIISLHSCNKITSYCALIVTVIPLLFATNLQAQQYPAEEGYAFEDAQYFYKWVTPEYPPLPDVRIDGEWFTWEEVYGFFPEPEPILVRRSKYPEPKKNLIEANPNLIPQDITQTNAAPIVENYEQIKRKLTDRVEDSLKNEKEGNERILKAAKEQNIPLQVLDQKGHVVTTLIDITENGEPLYVAPCNIKGMATIGVNKVWPSGIQTGHPNISSGESGLALSGDNVTIGMWEAPDVTGGSSVLTNHTQFMKSDGKSRVIMGNSSSVSPHATAIAGVLASGGKDTGAFIVDTNGFPVFNTELGFHTRGVCYNATIHAYSLVENALSTFTSTLYSEATNGLSLANNSFDIQAGWVKYGGDWYWHGGTNVAVLEDWKFGAYTGNTIGYSGTSSVALDQSATNAPYTLMVFPSGNASGVGPQVPQSYYYPGNTTLQTEVRNWANGDQGGYDTLSPTACAKNVLTVGGIYAVGSWDSNPTVTLATNSSFGPTDDGRIKPEIVAAAMCSPDDTVYNLGYSKGFWLPSYNVFNVTDLSHYSSITNVGTSFASAAVTGGLGLVLEQRHEIRPSWKTNYPVRSSTLRALAVHTAKEATDNPGPSYKFGYGVFDAVKAVNLMRTDALTNTKPYIKEVCISSKDNIQFQVKAANWGTPIKVTIAWNDPPGTNQTSGAVDETTKRLINDLDLRIYPPGITNYNASAYDTLKPFILDPDLANKRASYREATATKGDDSVNNLEQVVVSTPNPNGVYTIRVTHKGETLSGGSQWVSIILSGVEVPTEDLEISNVSIVDDFNLNIKWNAVVGGIYILQSSDLTGNQSWVNVGNPISANKEIMTTTASRLLTGKKLYRIKRLY